MRKLTRGFTLVEVMIVVGIIGILSSVALPVFQNMQYRSRQAERTVILKTLQQHVEEYYLREGRFPQDWGFGFSGLWLNANPDWSPGTVKRPWRGITPGEDWRTLSFSVEGNVYYSYWGSGSTWPGARDYWLMAIGNLDGDSVQDQIQKEWRYNGVALEQWPGGNCNDCTWEWRWPPEGWSY